jgi:beta-lactamase class A
MYILKKWPRLTLFISMAILLAVGVLSGMLTLNTSKVICTSQFVLLNPDVVCGRPDVIKKTGYIKTQEKISSFIEEERTLGHVKNVSVYFRDLVNGPVFGIDETADFTSASLLKLPLAVSYMVIAEKEPELLNQRLFFSSSNETFAQTFSPSETIVANQPYRVDELLRRMLAYSDNNAYELLSAHLDASEKNSLIKEIYLEMGIIPSVDRYFDDITVRRYASIFRALFDASYLDPKLSNKLLGWLIQSDFKLGLVSGIPEGIEVAHKFGERSFPDGVKQLHDCGIIYYPDNPYLLCVMTRGNDFNELATMISNISKKVYEEVDSRKLSDYK